MKCKICGKQTDNSYCTDCRKIRAVYATHKLLEKTTLKDKINKATLITKKITSLEAEDLQILEEYQLLEKDRYRNYRWTDEDKIKEFLKEYDTTNKKFTINKKRKKAEKKKEYSIVELIKILEENYNLNSEITVKNFSEKLKINELKTRRLLEKLEEKHLIKQKRRGRYLLNTAQILIYKKRSNIKENKINTINNLKKPDSTKNEEDTEVNKKNPSGNVKKETSKKITAIKGENIIIPLLRKYIDEEIIIIPRNVNRDDLTENELYGSFNKYLEEKHQYNLSFDEFLGIFKQVINAYPHIRHQRISDEIRYNIKFRTAPAELLEKLYRNNQKLTQSEENRITLEENMLILEGFVDNNELAQMYTIIVYTHEKIRTVNIDKNDEKTKIKIVYDLNEENPELWMNFIKSFNF